MGLRERKKERTRCALERAAMRLFRRDGFDATTVDDIALGVDVSPRTFFRYFASKEEVLFGDWRAQIASLRQVFEQRPPDEPILTSFRVLTQAMAAQIEAERERYATLHGMAEHSASLGAYERQQILPAWESMLCEVLANRMAVDPTLDPRPGLTAAIGIAVVTHAKQRWLQAGPETPLQPHLEASFQALLDLLAPVPPAAPREAPPP